MLWRKFARPSTRPVQDDRNMPRNVTIVIFALAVGLVSFTVRIWLPVGWTFGPLNFQIPFFTQYVALFIVGILAYQHNWLTRIPEATGKLWLGIALILIVVLFPVILVAGGAAEGDITAFAGGLHWQCLAYSVWEQFVCVAMIITLSVLFRKRLNHQGAIARAASASSYTTYIIHTPVIILVALALRHIALYPLLKFVLVTLIAVPTCFLLANGIRKLPLARKIL